MLQQSTTMTLTVITAEVNLDLEFSPFDFIPLFLLAIRSIELDLMVYLEFTKIYFTGIYLKLRRQYYFKIMS